MKEKNENNLNGKVRVDKTEREWRENNFNIFESVRCTFVILN